MGNVKSHDRNSKAENLNGSLVSFNVDIGSIFSNLSARSTGNSVRSAVSNHSCGKSNISKRKQNVGSSTGSDPYLNSKTVWPVTFCETPFLPEFPIRSGIDESHFEVLDVVSSGAYGKVSKVMKKDSGIIYAMKVMSKSKILMEDAVRQVKDEIKIQTLCGHHPFLIPSLFHWQSRKHLFLVTEFIAGGDLHHLWKETGYFEEELIQVYCGELALALDFLHNAGIIYRDLKMENILIDDAGHIKLIDFGLSKWLSQGSRTGTLCGTLYYMAPEVLRQEPYTHSADWWSLGVLVFALLQGQFPFRGLSDCEETPSFEFAAQPQCSQAVRRLVSGLLTREPNQRIRSLRQLERHAFYHHFDFEVLRSKKVDPLPLLDKQRQRHRHFSDEDNDFVAFDENNDIIG